MADRQFQIGGEFISIHDNGSSWAMAVGNQTYTTIATGEHIAGTVVGVVGTAAARLVYLMADAANAGTVFIGGTGVTVSNGTADTTTGWQMAAGDTWGPLPIDNVSRLNSIAGTAAQRIIYVALS